MSNRLVINFHPDKTLPVEIDHFQYSDCVHLGDYDNYTAIFFRTRRDLVNFKNNFNQAYETLLRKEKNLP